MPFSVDKKFVAQTEEKLGMKFPPGFVARMLFENGGAVRTRTDAWQLFPFLDSSDRKRIARTCNDIVRETKVACEWPGFPENAVAIGDNGCGDKLVLLRSNDDGSRLDDAVYWWDHETGELHRVADDFDELK